jgi:hypothetical protein
MWMQFEWSTLFDSFILNVKREALLNDFECDASRATDLMCRFFPGADRMQIQGSIRFRFRELNPNEIISLSQKFYSSSDANEAIGLVT